MTNFENKNNSKFLNNVQIVAVNTVTGAERPLQGSICLPAYNEITEAYINHAEKNSELVIKLRIKPEYINSDPLFASIEANVKKSQAQQQQAQAQAQMNDDIPF